MTYSFGERSRTRLYTCHRDLDLIMNTAISMSDVDFSIVEGHRTIERQHELFQKGLSKIDGVSQLGKHNLMPSHAVDIVIYTKDKNFRKRIAYDWTHLAYVAGVITTCAKQLHLDGEVTHLIRWGGNWDKDGILKMDQSFLDGPHFEIYKP